MPKILIYKNLVFFFYAADINERGHVHVIVGKNYSNASKIWFEKKIELFEKGSLTKTELTEAIAVVTKNVDYITKQWDNFKQSKKTTIKYINKL